MEEKKIIGIKKILIVDKQLPEYKYDPLFVLKKYKTIVKNSEYFNQEFLDSVETSFKWLLESWEVLSENKISLLCAQDGSRLKSVHVISHKTPLNGSKVLFQTEKLMIIKIANGIFDISKHSIDTRGKISTEVIMVDNYKTLEDIKLKAPNDLEEILGALIEKHDEYLKEYSSPIYAIV